ncbi:MAG: efflux RND transporter periplasmic adaptor subunit [Mesorhizobium sp.]|nr:efflux RND transporter periplasmic adaptor subunit [Mesorhizobium sp.]MBL8577888.1 efflux RND transporter periplasmic adaptor subunit [Mesorhizobium sp.]
METARALAPRIFAAFTLIALAGCSDEKAEVEKPRPVRTVIATPAYVDQMITQTGEIRPHIETDLGFRIDGRVSARKVNIGAVVAKGDVLATLDDRDVLNELRSVQADLTSAISASELAKTNLDRQRSLFEKQVVAKARVDEADSNWRATAARRDAAEAAVETAKRKVGYTNLIADSTGIVTAIGANAGQVVGAGQMVARIANTAELDAVFDVSERVINISPATIKVRVSLVSDPSVAVTGTVRDVSPTADPATRSYRVRIALPDAPAGMAFGAAVTGKVELPVGNMIALPATALTSVSGKPAVYVVDREAKKLQRREVSIAKYSDTQILVASGLQAGDAVVISGVSKLRPDQIVVVDGAGK